MARIPYIQSDPMRQVLPNSGSPAMATPDAFGASVGEAQARAGASLGQNSLALGGAIIGAGVAAGNLAQQVDENKTRSATASGVANFDYTNRYLELQKTAPADGQTFQQTVSNDYDQTVDKYLEGMSNDEVRNRVKRDLMARKPAIMGSAADFQNREAVANDKLQADAGVTTQLNRVRSDGSIDTWNDALKLGTDVIDARPGLTPAVKNGMKKGYAEELAKRRFEGLISAARDNPEALSTLELELTMPESPWKTRMSPEAYDRTLDQITTLKKAANSAENAAARSALQSVAQRNNDGVVLDPGELKAVQDVVMASKNPALLSQFAMINKQQDIYRTHRDLPLDQQRAKIAEMRNAKGITALPAPVQAGIGEGAAATNGQISVEYLAGLVNFEYGQHLASGDYGKGTGHKNADGTPSSNAAGIAQFTVGTWRDTVRKHAAAMGIDPNATDAEIEALRLDKTEAGARRQIIGAALHALDNKQLLENGTGRPVNDADLYFAHFLGVGGAVRFLNAANQNPNSLATQSVDKAQVDANRPVFYDEAGRPRTNAQVRSFVAQGSMNAPSRVDYAGIKAAELTLRNTEKGLKDDPISFAASTGRFGPVGDVSTAEGMARRGVVAGNVAEYYKIPAAQFQPFTKDEAEALTKRAADGTAEETLGVIGAVQALGNPDIIRAGIKQLKQKDALFGYAANLSYEMPDQKGVAADIIRGEKRIKADKDVMATIGMTETDLQAAFTGIVGKALAGTTLGTDTRKAAMAHYVERQLSRGAAQPGKFDKALFEESVQLVLGGGANPGKRAIDNVNGAPTLMPKGMNGPDFDRALDKLTVNDYTALSKWGGPPRFKDGKVADPAAIAREGTFEALGAGEYRIKMGDGGYLFSAAYKDGSADFYIFRGDPDRLIAAGQRQSVTVRPVPRVEPAKPRVIE